MSVKPWRVPGAYRDSALFERYEPDDVMHVRLPWNVRTECGQSIKGVGYHERGKFPTCIVCIGKWQKWSFG